MPPARTPVVTPTSTIKSATTFKREICIEHGKMEEGKGIVRALGKTIGQLKKGQIIKKQETSPFTAITRGGSEG